MIVDEIRRKALKIIDEDFEVLDFSLALPYTYVLIKGEKGKSLGVAMTLREEIKDYRGKFDDISVESFIKGVNSLNVVERTIGLATVNAISQYYLNPNKITESDVVEILSKDLKRVAVVGNMIPVVKALKNRGYEVYVFERNPSLHDENTLSDSFEYRLLPEMDAVLISGTALINDTIDLILERSKKARLKVLVGATAQVLPEFFKNVLTHIASIRILDVEKVLLSLKLGSAAKLFDSRFSRKYVVRV